MQTSRISVKKAKQYLNLLKNNRSLYKRILLNIQEVVLFIKTLIVFPFVIARFSKGEEIVHFGELDGKIIQHNSLFKYAKVPLGIILSGEVIVLEEGKGVKRLLPGDFAGLFESAFYLLTGSKRKIGKWQLVADCNTSIIFFGDFLSLKSKDTYLTRFKTFLVDLARQDIVPKPITDLPLLDLIANQATPSLLENTIIITHTHLLPSNFAFFRHLAHLVGYHNLFILEKPYSTIRSVFNRLISMGVDVIPVIIVEHAPYELSLKRSIDVLWDKVISTIKERRISRIVIVDDGGDILLSVPWERLKFLEIVGVEQTQRGINRIKNASYKIPTVIDVATSSVKKNIESLFIGKAAVDKIKSLGLLDNFPRIGIIGRGSIGRAISSELKNKGIKFLTYSITNPIQDKKEIIASIDTILNKSDIIIGATGIDFLKGVALERIEGKKTLISVSSADIEFFSLLNLASFSARPFETIHLKVNQNLTLKILNGGYPINFDREFEWEPTENIQITRCLLYAGLMQAQTIKNLKNKGKIVPLQDPIQKIIVKQWIRFKKGNQHVNKSRGILSLPSFFYSF